MIVHSMDVDELYPSIGVNRSAEIVGETFRGSIVKVDNVDIVRDTFFFLRLPTVFYFHQPNANQNLLCL